MTSTSIEFLPSVLVVRDVHFGYEMAQPILCGLSGTLAGGRLGVLIGPNAAGKSTLLRLILGQIQPWSGDIQVMGEGVGAMSGRQRANLMSYVPQRAGVGFAFNVEEVVAMGRYARTSDPGAVDHALAECELLPLRRRVYSQLSFGQQQRVLFARALAQASGGGRLMLLDEPGSAMDLWHVHHMMAVLRRRAQEGMTILVVLHDLNLAARYADEVWLMDQGRLVAAGPWQSVLQPSVLEPVYRVRLRALTVDGGERPVFAVDPVESLSPTGITA